MDITKTIEIAVEYHQAGRLEEAERLYQDVLQHEPGRAVVLHSLGVIAHQKGKHDVAAALIALVLLAAGGPLVWAQRLSAESPTVARRQEGRSAPQTRSEYAPGRVLVRLCLQVCRHEFTPFQSDICSDFRPT